MKAKEVATLARKLMDQYGLENVPFEFCRTKKGIAHCWFRAGKVTKIDFSEYFIPVLTDAEIETTIRHEIAHALAGHAAGHGPKWKRKARELGIDPKRTKTLTAEAKERFGEKHAKYRATCVDDKCNNVVYFNRMGASWKRGNNICGVCRSDFEVVTLR